LALLGADNAKSTILASSFPSARDIKIEPDSKASGLSIEFLNVTAEKPQIADSSLIVPESDITHRAES
jgi:hypothetical protein